MNKTDILTCELNSQNEVRTWRKNPVRFVAMTGCSFKQFNVLLPYFEQAHNAYFSKFQINGKRRTGGRRFVLYANGPLPTIANRLAFILSYLKRNPLQEPDAADNPMLLLHDATEREVPRHGMLKNSRKNTAAKRSGLPSRMPLLPVQCAIACLPA